MIVCSTSWQKASVKLTFLSCRPCSNHKVQFLSIVSAASQCSVYAQETYALQKVFQYSFMPTGLSWYIIVPRVKSVVLQVCTSTWFTWELQWKDHFFVCLFVCLINKNKTNRQRLSVSTVTSSDCLVSLNKTQIHSVCSFMIQLCNTITVYKSRKQKIITLEDACSFAR